MSSLILPFFQTANLQLLASWARATIDPRPGLSFRSRSFGPFSLCVVFYDVLQEIVLSLLDIPIDYQNSYETHRFFVHEALTCFYRRLFLLIGYSCRFTGRCRLELSQPLTVSSEVSSAKLAFKRLGVVNFISCSSNSQGHPCNNRRSAISDILHVNNPDIAKILRGFTWIRVK